MTIDQFIAAFNIVALVVMMLAAGMQLSVDSIGRAAWPARLAGQAIVANFILVPLAAAGLLILFQPTPMIAVGILTLAVCPGAPVGPVATAIAKGNVPWAISLMMMLIVLSAGLSPVLLSLMLKWIIQTDDIHLDYFPVIRTLLLAQLLPLSVGLAIRHFAPKQTRRIAGPVNRIANLLLIGLVVIILISQYHTLADIRARGWFGMGLLFAACLIIGWLSGGADQSIRKALAVTTSSRNAAAALAIVTGSFAGTDAISAVASFGIVSILGTLAFAAFSGKTSSVC